MKVFIWEGEGVLEDWDTGLAVAYAATEKQARNVLLKTMDLELADEEQYPASIYSTADKKRWSERNKNIVKNLPAPARVVDLTKDNAAFAVYLPGGA